VHQEKSDVEKARREHETQVQRHREQVTQMNSHIDNWKVETHLSYLVTDVHCIYHVGIICTGV